VAESTIKVEKVSKRFSQGIIRKRLFLAVNEVSLQINKNEVFGLVGESGSGKTTLLKIIFALLEPTRGRVIFKGKEITGKNKIDIKFFRQRAQIVFQDPYASLNPRKTVKKTLYGAAGMIFKTKAEQSDKVKETMELVGLSPWNRYLWRFPHELSGGERQRVGIARALVAGANFIGADEPVSNLDVSIRALILNLFRELQSKLGLTMILVSHDLAIVRSLSDTTAVMYCGNIVEMAKGDEIFTHPIHPYTQLLIDSCLLPNPSRERRRQPMIDIDIDVDTNSILPHGEQTRGCGFYSRCRRREPACLDYQTKLEAVDTDHAVACQLV